MVRLAFLRTVGGLCKRYWATALFVLVALGIWAWVSWEAVYVRMVTWDPGTDYWEHSATLRALIENPFHPDHPHLAIHAGSPRFGPQFLLIALIARALHWDAMQAMSLAASLNTLLFVSGIYVFFRKYFRQRLAPLYGLLVMFGAWWHAFHFSNVYELRTLFAVASFPSTTALGLTLLGFALTVSLLRSEVRRPLLSLLLLAVWAAAVFIIHPLTAMLSLSGAVLLSLAEPAPSFRLRGQVVVAIVIGCALSHFWPYFSPWVVLRGGSGTAADWTQETLQQATAELQVKRKLHMFYRPTGLLMTLGAGSITLVCLPYFFLRRQRLFVGLGVLSMLAPFVANAFVEIPLGHRFVLLAIVYLHIGLVWILLRLTPSFSFRPRSVLRLGLGIVRVLLVAALLGVFFVHSVLVAQDQLDHPRYAKRDSPTVRQMQAVASAAGPGAIVLASPMTSWPIPTFGPKVLVLFHQDPLVPDASERERSVGRFLGPGSSDDDRRMILAHYRVTHVLLNRLGGAPARFLARYPSVKIGAFRLYDITPAPPGKTP